MPPFLFVKESDRMAKFASKCPNQILTIIPNRRAIQDGIVMPKPGRHINFNAGEYTTTDKQEINFIHAHPMFGVSIVEVEDNS